jgi:acetyl-CoA hydrolase
MLKPGSGVVTTRNHVRYVVTEYGIADLYAKTLHERAKALIYIAHPDFRTELKKQAAALHYF